MISDEGSPLQSIKAPLRTIAVTHDGPNCCVDRIKLTEARRVVVKVGTQVVSRVSDGRLALGRLGSLIEQIEVLIRSGRQVILVSSGSVGAGKQRMRREQILNSSPLDLQGFNNSGASQEAKASVQSRAAAACGQSGIMALYDLLFGHMDLACSQLLISRNDFLNKDFKVGLRQTVDHLLNMNVIPVFNENDAISYHSTTETQEALKTSGRFWDNDSLAMRVAAHMDADLLVLLTDVEGLYTGAPDLPDSELISTYCPEIHDEIVRFGAKSTMGRGGMSSKAECAWMAAEQGVSTLIVNGKSFRPTLVEAVSGEPVGTLFDCEVAAAMLTRYKETEAAHNHKHNGLKAEMKSEASSGSYGTLQDAVLIN